MISHMQMAMANIILLQAMVVALQAMSLKAGLIALVLQKDYQ